jgi:hypothetical protein
MIKEQEEKIKELKALDTENLFLSLSERSGFPTKFIKIFNRGFI